MEGLDSIARRYGKLPSEVLRVKDELKGIAIDFWAHNWGVQRDAYLAQKATRSNRGRSA